MKKDKQKETIEFWTEMVECYFSFFREKFYGEKPTFDCSSPRDLKTIVLAIKKKADDKQIEWTLDIALRSLKAFFETAYQDKWIRENFVLIHLNRNKDKIFIEIARKKNLNSSNTYLNQVQEKLSQYKPTDSWE
jgi:hypothetical protein